MNSNSLKNWVDDMDQAFPDLHDNSCSLLSINFSFDFAGPSCLSTSREPTTANNHQANNGLSESVTVSRNKAISYGLNMNHDLHTDNSNNFSNFFKKFKPNDGNSDEDNRTNNQNKLVRQWPFKNSISTTSINNGSISGIINNGIVNVNNNNPHNLSGNCPNADNNLNPQSQVESGSSEADKNSPRPPSNSHSNRNSATSTPEESAKSSTSEPRSPSPSSTKQKFRYVLAEPTSVATKLTEDTMTYLNQGQAYEIKLENITDVAEAKKGFMCSIINIGFHERHMQQAENELWQQWIQQHPNEKIFSVDMKLSYNIFGVEWDGLNKYEFLWDSSKAAGVFIRVNSISTEFTPKKHGGEKGVPFKLSIETFSYNSKTHDSYFISAACCQIKVFKPKGAERKIRSDKDKISKRPVSEQEKYHRSSDHTIFKECSLASLHPSADESLCYYRHSHGHFASKQVISSNSGGTPLTQAQQVPNGQLDEKANNNTSLHPNNIQHSQDDRDNHNTSSEGSANQNNINHREYQAGPSRNLPAATKIHQTDYSAARLLQPNNQYSKGGNQEHVDSHNNEQSFTTLQTTNETSISHANELIPFQQPNAFNQMYHGNQVRGVTSLASINSSQHFAYYSHTLPSTIPHHIPPPTNYGPPICNTISTMSHANHHGSHNFHLQPQQHANAKGGSSVYRNLTHEKNAIAMGAPTNASFKASNLAIASHNSLTNYFGPSTEHCEGNNNQIQDSTTKDSNLNNGSYMHYNNELHINNQLNQTQQPLRQRSASLSATNGHCNNYISHFNQNRHFDNYTHLGNNNLNENNIPTSNQWMSNQTSSPSSDCTQRAESDIMNQNQETNNYNDNNNYDCNNDNYDSDQNSPQKNHQHTSDSSSSCYSRYKNSSSILPSNQDHYELTKVDSDPNQTLSINSSCAEVSSWLTENRFGTWSKTFNNFNGSDLLRLSKPELIEICGLIDGIRLYNSLHNQPIRINCVCMI